MSILYRLYDEIEKMDNLYLYYYKVGKPSVIIEEDWQYGIFLDLSEIKTLGEEIVCLAHELAHAKTGTTHKVYSPLQLVSKNEYKANKQAVHDVIPYNELIDAFDEGVVERWELAEYFDVTEDFISKAIEIYSNEGKSFKVA